MGPADFSVFDIALWKSLLRTILAERTWDCVAYWLNGVKDLQQPKKFFSLPFCRTLILHVNSTACLKQ